MDLVGIEGLVVGQNCLEQQQVLEGKPKFNGSGSIKQERSDPFEDESNRASKVAKRAGDLGMRSNTENALPKEQMLSFSSSSKPEVSFLSGKDLGLISDKNAPNLAFSYFQQSAYSRSPTGFGSGNLNGSMHGPFTRIRGPFTPAQWIELEHQAMIYKYLIANIPVPANLLVPIRKALTSSGFPGFSLGSYPSHSYGWGSFHLGYSGSMDPEPGRCRRTDGKKWRCSRDAVPDQKYCERHINRGRHRSRKPVEGHTGQAASGPTSTKGVPAMSASASSLVTSSGGAFGGVTIAQHQIKGLQPTGATNASTDPIVNRYHDQQGLTVMPSTMNSKTEGSPFTMKQNIPVDESSQSEFGFVSTDSLLNPSQKGSYFSCKGYNSLLEFSSQQTHDQYPLRHYMPDLPKDQPNRSAIPWPEELKSDWTQLSMSIPMSSDFSSSSVMQDKTSPSPLRLSHELDPSEMGSRLGYIVGEAGPKQNARIPVSWENPMGGPLGEVLNNAASNARGSFKAQSLKGEAWDGSPELGSSPTGVLQKPTFVSLSNSSSSGSPRGENKKTQEGGKSLR